MKKILGLDLGTNSIGWAVVNEAENENEKSAIVKMGVRVNPLSVDELQNFEKGKAITTNAYRTLKRNMRRNLSRYKERRAALIEEMIKAGFITEKTILSEHGNKTTFETYKLRAKAAMEKVSLEELARILLMINKKRGYKSSRKAKGNEDGRLIDGMDVAKRLYDEDITPGELSLQLLAKGKKRLPDFYRSDLQDEFDKVWKIQQQFYPECLTCQLKDEIKGKNKTQTWNILVEYFKWEEEKDIWDDETLTTHRQRKECHLIGLKRMTKGVEQKKENFQWRVKALSEKIGLEELAVVFQEINGEIYSSSGYLGAISDRSKELFFKKQTVGQYLMSSLDKDPNVSLKNKVFYRQDYLDEFEIIWEKQSEYHKELTHELKKIFRDTIIFYQRRLKSQKGLVGFCEFERKELEIEKNGKKKSILIGSKVIPRSSPLFQEFKIWQTLNNIEVSVVEKQTKKKNKYSNMSSLFDLTESEDSLISNGRRFLTIEEKRLLAEELFIRDKMTKKEALSLLFENPVGLDLNFEIIDGDRTGSELYQAFGRIIEMSGHEPVNFKKAAHEIVEYIKTIFNALGWNTDILFFDSAISLDSQPYYKLWHLLYSFEGDSTVSGDGKLVDKLSALCHINKEYAQELTTVIFQNDYGSLSAKAIHKILPCLKEGCQYDVACVYAGYRHSKSSLTKEEINNKVLKERLKLLPKNSLRNPVVEKILNQMVNVVNSIVATYGRPDEIRVELARELKKNTKEREKLFKSIALATKEQEEIRKILQEKFGLSHVSRNDIIRYRLYEELKKNGYKTLYSNTYVSEEKLFSKEFDIEHIIPKARLFDDSFSNKTLEVKSVNIEKGNKTAYDFVKEKFGEEALQQYLNRCEELFKNNKTKLRKLKMQGGEIPDDFIDRDLRNTQYIAKKTLAMLSEICRRVVATTGSVTNKLREDWQLVDVMKELNWEKYRILGCVDYYEDKDGRKIGRIKDWNKRNDHRHHAMDALTIAFTKDVFIQYFNNKNASDKPNTNEYAIKNKYFVSGRAIPPMPLNVFRTEAKKHLESILISIKAKNKVVTRNVNKIHTKNKNCFNEYVQLTPRGQLHNETIYRRHRKYVTKEEKVNASFDILKIGTVCKRMYREALLKRLHTYDDNPKKAFTGKNSLEKNPVWLNEEQTVSVPVRVKTVNFEFVYTVRKLIDEKVVDKVVDTKIRQILQNRIKEYGSAKKAFSNLDEHPIWFNQEKGLVLKRVSVYEGFSDALALHDKKDKDGKFIVNSENMHMPVDFVKTGNNHHVAIYSRPSVDKQGRVVLDGTGNPMYELEEVVVSFFEAVARVNSNLPVINKDYRCGEGWKFLYTMKQNEYFVFPNEKTGFNPNDIDLFNPDNYALISPNLFRVQKFSSKDYMFRHHLETTVEEKDELRGVAWKRICSMDKLRGIIKVRVDNIGQIVAIGE